MECGLQECIHGGNRVTLNCSNLIATTIIKKQVVYHAIKLRHCARSLGALEMVRLYDGTYRIDHTVTSAQKNILKAFGVYEQWVKKKAKEIRDTLAGMSAIALGKKAKPKK